MMSSPNSGSRQLPRTSTTLSRSVSVDGAVSSSGIRSILPLDVQIDVAIGNGHRIRLGRDHGGQAGDFPGAHIEARPMPGALHRHLPELALAQRVVLVGTGVGDGVELIVLRVNQADR